MYHSVFEYTSPFFLRISVVCFCPLVCSHASYSMFEYTIFFLACSRLVLVLLFTLSPFLGWGGGGIPALGSHVAARGG